MGKRSGGLNFYDAMRQGRTSESENQRAEESIQQGVASIADKQFDIEMPSETIQQDVPQATPVADEPIIKGTNRENIFRADLTTETDVQGSAEGIQRAQQANIPQMSEGLFPDVVGTATNEQAEALYNEQLEDESVKRAGMDNDTAKLFGEFVDLESLFRL